MARRDENVVPCIGSLQTTSVSTSAGFGRIDRWQTTFRITEMRGIREFAKDLVDTLRLYLRVLAIILVVVATLYFGSRIYLRVKFEYDIVQVMKACVSDRCDLVRIRQTFIGTEVFLDDGGETKCFVISPLSFRLGHC